MGTLSPFIVQKMNFLREMQLKESKKRHLENSYKTAMEAVAKGDTLKVPLLDASFVELFVPGKEKKCVQTGVMLDGNFDNGLRTIICRVLEIRYGVASA
jgi:hypothetical protein